MREYERWIGDIYLMAKITGSERMVIIHGVTGTDDIRKMMEELRAEDPEAAMLLGEFIVIEEEG